jgi:hypothetical protein
MSIVESAAWQLTSVDGEEYCLGKVDIQSRISRHDITLHMDTVC